MTCGASYISNKSTDIDLDGRCAYHWVCVARGNCAWSYIWMAVALIGVAIYSTESHTGLYQDGWCAGRSRVAIYSTESHRSVPPLRACLFVCTFPVGRVHSTLPRPRTVHRSLIGPTTNVDCSQPWSQPLLFTDPQLLPPYCSQGSPPPMWTTLQRQSTLSPPLEGESGGFGRGGGEGAVVGWLASAQASTGVMRTGRAVERGC